MQVSNEIDKAPRRRRMLQVSDMDSPHRPDGGRGFHRWCASVWHVPNCMVVPRGFDYGDRI